MTDPIDLDRAREKRKRKPHNIPETDWASELRTDQDGRITADVGNAALLLANDSGWAGSLVYDDFADRIYWASEPPAMSGFERPAKGQDIADHHATYVHHWFARRLGVTLKKGAVQDAMVAAARMRTVHPLRDYLTSIRWDGKPRLDNWLTTYLGAEKTRYTSHVGRWWAVSAIARALNPGCQADHMLVLEGSQGIGKSSALRILAGEWYLPCLPDIKNPAAGHMLQGNWIAEVGELDALRRQELTTVKDFVTRIVDKYRPPYGRFQVVRPRQIVFAATTNEDAYLHDSSGARRFWPVATNQLDRNGLERDRDQLWAEAVTLYRAGAAWWPDEGLSAEVKEEQSARHATDEWEQPIIAWVNATAEPRSGFTIGDVLKGALTIEQGKWTRADQTRVGSCLRSLGFSARQQRGTNGERERRYYADPSTGQQLSLPSA